MSKPQFDQSGVNSWNIREPIYYPGGSAPEGSPTFRTRTVVDISDYYKLKAENDKLHQDLEAAKADYARAIDKYSNLVDKYDALMDKWIELKYGGKDV